jgi:mRNA interferase RelE/StbE
MPYKIVILSSAEKEIRKLSAKMQDRIFEKIEALSEEPRPSGVKKLKKFEMVNKDFDSYYRIRVGDFRIIYAVEDDIITVTITRVGNRVDVYDE